MTFYWTPGVTELKLRVNFLIIMGLNNTKPDRLSKYVMLYGNLGQGIQEWTK